MSAVRCYAVPGKQRSYDLMKAFAEGCRGIVDDSLKFKPGPSAFYGVWPNSLPLFQEATRSGFPWYYVDNSYFDVVRGVQWRVTRNAQQCNGKSEGDPERWRRLGLEVAPWRRTGKHILVAHQSPFWYVRHGLEGWAAAIESDLRKVSTRPIRHRGKPGQVAETPVPLAEDLRDCWVVVVHSSAVGVEALLRGIPIIATAPCALSPMSGELGDIEELFYPADRERFFSVLAANQWTADEIRGGTAWRSLNLDL